MEIEQLSAFVVSAMRERLPPAQIAAKCGVSEEELRVRVGEYLRLKAETGPAELIVDSIQPVQIERDQRGIPHITAENDHDLYFGAGFAQAQDRLWQLDYLRRQAYGTLAEVFGPSKLESDILSRTLGIRQVAQANLAASSARVTDALEAFAAGVNCWIERQPHGLPIEFELIEYEPEPWTAFDSLAILRRWWWYLTGRLGVITTPEAIWVGVGDGDLYDAYLQPDAEPVTIVKPGEYATELSWPGLASSEPQRSLWGPSDHIGSNNWVVGPAMSSSGFPLLASDPHVYDTVPAEWYEMRLTASGIDTAGCGYPAMPFVAFGRNRHLAWGITNNICSLRDLYIEQGDKPSSGQREELIRVRGTPDHHHVTRFISDRPVVDHLLPPGSHPADLLGEADTSVTLAWVGFEQTSEPEALFDLNRAGNVPEARRALSQWRCPTFNMVLADDQGEIGYQAVGAIPVRGREHRGYRRPDRADDTWQGYIPYDAMPRVERPQRQWIVSANNPTAPAVYPWPLSGTWSPEDRAYRAEQLIQEHSSHNLDTFAAMQTDIQSGRAERGTPALLAIIEPVDDAHRSALAQLRSWDFRMTTSSAAAAIYYVFFWRWHQAVVRERFSTELHALVQDAGWGLSSALLHNDMEGWFASDESRVTAIRSAFAEALQWLSERFGPDQATWRWGDLHTLGAVHPAATTPLQHDVLDIPPQPHNGGASTLASAFYTPAGSFESRLGANFRLLTSLAPEAEMQTICWPGQSGQPGSPHYDDQVNDHLAGRYRQFQFDEDGLDDGESIQRLAPTPRQ